METTMAATPKARLATAAVPPPNTARMLPPFAFPPPNDPDAATRHQDICATRRTTVRVRARRDSVSDSIANVASWIEQLALPKLPDDVWTFIARAWFFVAGATAGVLLALALIAITGPKAPAAKQAREGHAEGTARVLVVQRATTAGERGIGALAQNDVDEVAPPRPQPVVRRQPVVARRPANRGASSKDILNAGL